MKNKERFSLLRCLLITLASIVTLAIVAVCALLLFMREEIKIVGSLEKIGDRPIYSMEVYGDYHFEEFLNAGGASSDHEVSAFLTDKISHGFYSIDIENDGLACSTISAQDADGSHVWGRNFDWTSSVPIIVTCFPENGYSSISTCDFQNISGSADIVPEGIAGGTLAISALYVPMDGINSAGLCVADLEVNEGGMPDIDTDKDDLTITTAIRLLLNNAATVDEAVSLLEQYDIHPSGGISHHLSISDATGASVVIEFTKDGAVAVETEVVTNFNHLVGNTAAGGSGALERYETLCSLQEDNGGIFSREQIRDALSRVMQSGIKWNTQWSLVWSQSDRTVDYYFDGDYSQAYSFSLAE